MPPTRRERSGVNVAETLASVPLRTVASTWSPIAPVQLDAAKLGRLDSRLRREARKAAGEAAAGRLLKHPLGWIARDSTVLLTIAAGLIGTVIVVAVTRLAGSKTIGQRQILFASIAYSVGFAATYTGVGVAIKQLVQLI